MLAACLAVPCAERPGASFEESEALQGQDGGSLCLPLPVSMLLAFLCSVHSGVGFYSLTRLFGEKKSLEASLQVAEDDDGTSHVFLPRAFSQLKGGGPMSHCRHFQWLIKF